MNTAPKPDPEPTLQTAAARAHRLQNRKYYDGRNAPSAIGVEGRALLDETGLVAGWELLGGPDADTDLRTGRFPDDFSVEGFGPDSNEIVVVWSTLPCQLEPVGQVTSSDGVRPLASPPVHRV